METTQVVLTGVLALATIVLAFATWTMSKSTKVLADETRKAREDSKKPLLSVKLKAYEEHGDFIQLVVANVGKGAAFDVDFQIGADQGVLTKQGLVMRGTMAPISFIASGESEVYEMGPSRTLFEHPPLPPFPVKLTYADVDGQVTKEEITLDVRQFELLQWRGASVAWRQMTALEQFVKSYRPR